MIMITNSKLYVALRGGHRRGPRIFKKEQKEKLKEKTEKTFKKKNK